MTNALVIDDHRESANMICSMLSFLGVDARPAYGPREAMMVLKDQTPDIIFLDISMPGVDGFEVMSYFRRFPHLDNVPFIFITNDDQPETETKMRKTGALLIIIKPATIESLEAALKKAGLFI